MDPELEPPLSTRDSVRYGLGAATMFLAFLAFAVLALDSIFGLPFWMPPSFYHNRAIWVGLAIVLVAVSWVLQAPAAVPRPKRWRPSQPGRRFQTLRIYGRNECHLCDDAVDLLEKYVEWLPPFELVNIDEDPALVERFGTQIPVVELDGRVRFRGRVSEVLLRRLLEGTPPVSSPAA